MIEFSDILLGRIAIPDWLGAFLKLPEFARLRGVRLSNVDSYEFKDFSAPTRWEHSVAVAYLAHRCAHIRGLDPLKTIHLTLGGLLHDVATPPFGHTLEYVLPDFDHELESNLLLHAISGNEFLPGIPVFASQLPQFRAACRSLSAEMKVPVDPDQVADAVVGKGEFGFLIRGTLDLDNADNVTRACHYLGLEVDSQLPLRLADWLGHQTATPADIANCTHEAVQTWHGYRTQLYSAFFNASEAELARQAFLQHILRRAVGARFPRGRLVWNTDERLLYDLEAFSATESEWPLTLRDLIQRYSLLHQPITIANIAIDDRDQLRALKHPDAAAWIEKQVSSKWAELCVLVSSRRYADDKHKLFPPSVGSVLVFKVGGPLKREHLQGQLSKDIPEGYTGIRLLNAVAASLTRQLQDWAKSKPWFCPSASRESRIIDGLNYVGDWGFRLSQNDNVHPYPGTFVHAIPASLIVALGLRGERILDPFGGTGQTAVEGIKYGCDVVSADINSIACLASRAKMTYLEASDIDALRAVEPDSLRHYHPCNPPAFAYRDRWFEPRTLDELCKIWHFITVQKSEAKKQFLKACFSAVLPSCTGRRGKQHGWFADNTPLSRGIKSPPYQDALAEFVLRIQRNLDAIGELYAYLVREGRDPRVELSKARILRADAARATPADYGIEPGTVAGVITSPPYLCMADYTLGQRLSYYWLFPQAIDEDFACEIGARRLRSRRGNALESYLQAMGCFAKNMAMLVRPGGFLCTVLGAPLAKAFKNAEIIEAYDRLLSEVGFELLWKRDRNIHWHRNYGYERLKTERVSVHTFRPKDECLPKGYT